MGSSISLFSFSLEDAAALSCLLPEKAQCCLSKAGFCKCHVCKEALNREDCAGSQLLTEFPGLGQEAAD